MKRNYNLEVKNEAVNRTELDSSWTFDIFEKCYLHKFLLDQHDNLALKKVMWNEF